MRTCIADGLFVLPDKPVKTGLKPQNHEGFPAIILQTQGI